METASKPAWVVKLPATGYDIMVLLHDGQEFTIPYGDIYTDDVMAHFSKISAPATQTTNRRTELVVQVRMDAIARIRYRDEFKRNCIVRNPRYTVMEIGKDMLLIKGPRDTSLRQIAKIPFLVKRERRS